VALCWSARQPVLPVIVPLVKTPSESKLRLVPWTLKESPLLVTLSVAAATVS